MRQSIRKKSHTVYRNENDAIQGDQILIECRKPAKWYSARGSGQHNYFNTAVSKNAYAVIAKSYTNIRK